MCNCLQLDLQLQLKDANLDEDLDEDLIATYRCENEYCSNKICDNCAILCDCCDHKICKSCSKLCEIESCQKYVCIPITKKINSDTLELEYNYEHEEKSCLAGCGRNYICI